MSYAAMNEIMAEAIRQDKKLWEIILEEDMKDRNTTREESMSSMKAMYEAMKESLMSYDPKQRSSSGLVGSDGEKIKNALHKQHLLSGEFMGKVMMRAVCVGECNACMKRIVAAPTAGSCGVLPAVLISIQEEKELSDEKMIEALFIAAGVGGIIAKRASISGAEGGCQAEIGSASCMAAAATAYLNGGSNEMISDAAAIAMKNLLGLVCDPVAGLVEVPCIKRNVIGAVGAIAAADLAIAGVKSVIPLDEVIDAMGEIGRQLPSALRETAEGGLAVTPTAIKLTKQCMERKE